MTSKIFYFDQVESTSHWCLKQKKGDEVAEADSEVRITPERPQRQRELVPVALP
jgi:hypothetical protein